MKPILNKDRQIIRNLAKHQLELANTPKNKTLKQEWLALNTFRPVRPMIHLELGTFEHEVVPPLLQCELAEARDIEARIYRMIVNQKLIGDDKPIPDYFPVHWKTWFTLFGHEITATHAANEEGSGLGHRFNHVIEDLEDDYHKLGASEYGVDVEASLKEEEFFNDLLGDIMPVKRVSGSLYAVPTQKIVHLMGMEHMLESLMLYPDIFKQMMDRVAEDYITYFKYLEDEGFLRPTVGAETLNQGSFCYTDELPAVLPKDRPLASSEVWGYLDSQESVGISPAMFSEFIFPCYKKIANVFGALSYGCCEHVHAIWDDISGLNNLKKVSISPWCDEEKMGENLRGKRIIYHRKPSATYLGVGGNLDEDAVRKHFETTLHAARGCTLEFSQRDVYTINNSIDKAKQYIQILRESIENNWQG